VSTALVALLAAAGFAPAQQAISTGTIAGVGFWRSGTPTTVTYTTTDAGGTDTMGGGDPVRVSMVSGCDPTLSRGERSEERWFDTSCFIGTPVGS